MFDAFFGYINEIICFLFGNNVPSIAIFFLTLIIIASFFNMFIVTGMCYVIIKDMLQQRKHDNNALKYNRRVTKVEMAIKNSMKDIERTRKRNTVIICLIWMNMLISLTLTIIYMIYYR